MSLIAYAKESMCGSVCVAMCVCVSCYLIACIWRCKSFHYTNSNNNKANNKCNKKSTRRGNLQAATYWLDFWAQLTRGVCVMQPGTSSQPSFLSPLLCSPQQLQPQLNTVARKMFKHLLLPVEVYSERQRPSPLSSCSPRHRSGFDCDYT